jgi:U6 snRNA-associated Sm-like protein LSm6
LIANILLPRGSGELQSVDGYMNIALEKTEEYVNGAKRRSYGDAFVRGNNGQCSYLLTLLMISDCCV